MKQNKSDMEIAEHVRLPATIYIMHHHSLLTTPGRFQTSKYYQYDTEWIILPPAWRNLAAARQQTNI